MFYGKYYHTIESKGRLSIPAKFRALLGDSAILTKGLDGCLFLFAQKVWDKKLAEIATLPSTKKASREYVRFLANNAQDVSFDELGRVHLDDELKNSAGLTKKVVCVGSLDHIEVWDVENYRTMMHDVETRIESVSEALPVQGDQSD